MSMTVRTLCSNALGHFSQEHISQANSKRLSIIVMNVEDGLQILIHFHFTRIARVVAVHQPSQVRWHALQG